MLGHSSSTVARIILWLVGISSAVVIIAAVMSYLYSKSLGPLLSSAPDGIRSANLRRVRWVSLILMALQVIFFLAILGLGSFIPHTNLLLPALAHCLGAVLLLGHVQFSVERKLRDIKVTTVEALKQTARILFATFALYGLYYGIYRGGLEGISSTLQALGLSEEWRFRMTWAAVPFTVFVALLALFLISPVVIRWMLPSGPVTDPAVIQVLERCFQKAGLPKPSFWMIEMDRYKAHNAMVTGLKWGRGPFRQALLFSRGLLDKLTLDEFEAIILHELSHLSLHHLRNRILFSVGGVVLSLGPILGISVLALAFLPKEYRVVTMLGCTLLSIGFQTFLTRRQIRFQEMEADANAVIGLGANLEAFSSGLRKLSAMNDQHDDKKDPHSYLIPGDAHPTMEKRIAAVKARMALKQLGRPLFSKWEWVSDLFEGPIRYVSATLLVALIASIVAGGYFTLPRYQLRLAAQRGDLDRIRDYLERGHGVDGADVFSFGMTPLMSAAEQGNPETIHLLLAAGANPNQRHSLGYTPLWFAVESGNLNIVKILVENGAQLTDAFPGGKSLPLLASARGHLPVLEFLAGKNLDLSGRDNTGATPLTSAALHGHDQIVRFLLGHGVDIHARDSLGNTALSIAVREGHLSVVKTLNSELEKLLTAADAKVDRGKNGRDIATEKER